MFYGVMTCVECLHLMSEYCRETLGVLVRFFFLSAACVQAVLLHLTIWSHPTASSVGPCPLPSLASWVKALGLPAGVTEGY